MKPERQQILARVDERLKEIRRDWAWLGFELGESAQNINHWRKKRGIPSAKYAAVATLLGWTVERLLGSAVDEESEWPFHRIPIARLEALTEGQLLQLEGVLLDKLNELEEPPEKYRPAATERSRTHSLRPARNRKTAS